MSIGPGWVEPNPEAYESPNGMEAALPGQPDNPGTRDPFSPTVPGSVTNMMERLHFSEMQIMPQGGSPGGDDVPLPPAYTPNQGA